METEQTNLAGQINFYEETLTTAFTKIDLITLDKLIHDDALFILPNGLTVTKLMVLDNYRKGDTSMTMIKSSDSKINFVADNAIVSVNLEMTGQYKDQKIKSQFRYLRVWKKTNDQWKVIAVCGVQLINNK